MATSQACNASFGVRKRSGASSDVSGVANVNCATPVSSSKIREGTTAVNASRGDPRIRGVRKLGVCNVTAHSGKPSGQNNSGGKELQRICCMKIDPCASLLEGRTDRSQATMLKGMWPESRRERHEREQGHVHLGNNPNEVK